MALVFVFVGLVGCGDIISFNNPAERRKEARRENISDFLSEDVTGETGETYQTKWFDFTIDSIDEIDSYAGHTAEEGNRLLKVQVAETSTWDETITLGTFDFYMDDPSFEEFIWPITPKDSTMMPEKFDLEPGATVQHVMIFDVPTNTTELALMYTEYYDNKDIGNTIMIYID